MNNRKKFTRERVDGTLDVKKEFGEGLIGDYDREINEKNANIIVTSPIEDKEAIKEAKKTVLYQLALDIKRDMFTVQGTLIEGKVFRLASQLAEKKFLDYQDEEKTAVAFKATLTLFLLNEGFSRTHIENFFRYYRQHISYTGLKLGALFTTQQELFGFHTNQNDLFFLNGKAYYSSSFSNFYFKDIPSSRIVKKIAGQVDSYFQLTDEGFKFLHFMASEEITDMIDKRLFNQKKIDECIGLMKKAIETKDLELYLFNLYLFKFHIRQTILKNNAKITEEEIYQKILGQDIQLLNQFQDNKQYSKIKRAIESNNHFDRSFMYYLSKYTPVETLLDKVNDFVGDKKSQDHFKRKLCEYQINHAEDIVTLQLNLIQPAPSRRSRFRVTCPKQKEKRFASDREFVYYQQLMNIKTLIFTVGWPTILGKPVLDEAGDEHIVPKHMVRLLEIIKEADQDATGKKTVWENAFCKALKKGHYFALHKSRFRFEATQEFYDTLSNTYQKYQTIKDNSAGVIKDFPVQLQLMKKRK